jgi:hypothetical protein
MISAAMGYVWGRIERHTGFCWGNLKERDHLEDRRADGRIILKLILLNRNGGMDCINLAQDRGKWRTVVNTVMNVRFS